MCVSHHLKEKAKDVSGRRNSDGCCFPGDQDEEREGTIEFDNVHSVMHGGPRSPGGRPAENVRQKSGGDSWRILFLESDWILTLESRKREVERNVGLRSHLFFKREGHRYYNFMQQLG